LGPHVDFVTPTIHFDAKLPKRSGNGQTLKSVGLPISGNGPKTTGIVLDIAQLNVTDLLNCDKRITPSCLRALYGFFYEPRVPWNNSYGIVEYTPQSYRQQDLDAFAERFDPRLVGVSPEMVSIDGGALSNQELFNITGESNLDLEYAMNLVTPAQNVTLYQVGDLVVHRSTTSLMRLTVTTALSRAVTTRLKMVFTPILNLVDMTILRTVVLSTVPTSSPPPTDMTRPTCHLFMQDASVPNTASLVCWVSPLCTVPATMASRVTVAIA
jgi:hypothetical protein